MYPTQLIAAYGVKERGDEGAKERRAINGPIALRVIWASVWRRSCVKFGYVKVGREGGFALF